MLRNYLISLLCLLLISTAALAQADATTRNAEIEAMLATIEAETACFFARDYECWKQHWVHADHAFLIWNNTDGSYTAPQGWPAIKETVGKYIRENPRPADATDEPRHVVRDNLTVEMLTPDLAFMVWDQYNANADGSSYQASKETRLMQRVNGTWRILNVTAVWDYSQSVAAEEVQRIDNR